MATKPLPTEDEILARFHRMRITIGLSRSGFGYLSVGVPNLISRLEEGHKLQPKNRERIAYCLDELEKGHSISMRTKPVNGKRTLAGDNNPILDRTSVLSGRELEE